MSVNLSKKLEPYNAGFIAVMKCGTGKVQSIERINFICVSWW